MEALPLKPNPEMALLPVNLGWLLYSLVAHRGHQDLPVAPCSSQASEMACLWSLLVGLLDNPHPRGTHIGEQDEIWTLHFFFKNKLPFIDMVHHVPRALQMATL